MPQLTNRKHHGTNQKAGNPTRVDCRLSRCAQGLWNLCRPKAFPEVLYRSISSTKFMGYKTGVPALSMPISIFEISIYGCLGGSHKSHLFSISYSIDRSSDRCWMAAARFEIVHRHSLKATESWGYYQCIFPCASALFSINMIASWEALPRQETTSLTVRKRTMMRSEGS